MELFQELKPSTVKLAVTGGRGFDDAALLYTVLNQFLRPQMPKLVEVIHGGARGADALAHRWAVIQGIKVTRIDAEWSALGDAAGPIRNQKILDLTRPNQVVAFKGNDGTRDMIERSINHRKLKLLDHVFVVERCPDRWWTPAHPMTCPTCMRQGFHVAEAQL